MKLCARLLLFALCLEAVVSAPTGDKEKTKSACGWEKKIVPTEGETSSSPKGAVEGDIMMTDEERTNYENSKMGKGRIGVRKAVFSADDLWPGGVIPYEYATIDESMKIFADIAMEEWSKKTCLQFVEHPAPGVTHLGKISFIDGSGCYAYMGFKNQTREVSLETDACRSTGIAMHELGHSIGLQHEHVRPDRDDYVTIYEENIQPGKEGNFDKRDPASVNTYGIQYDVCSVMHYDSNAFSKNGSPTITAVYSDYTSVMGNQKGISHFDYMIVNLMYGCNAHCTGGLSCNNNGYVGQDCTCVCPAGYTGVTCDDIVNEGICGGRISVTSSGTVKSPGYPGNYGDNRECHWLLEAPVGSRISIFFDDFYVENGGASCDYDNFDIRNEAHIDMCMYTYCAGTLKGQTHVSKENALMLSLYSDFSISYQGFSATYTLI